jgi:hypothetical protein
MFRVECFILQLFTHHVVRTQQQENGSVVYKGLFTALCMLKEDVSTAIYVQFITLSIGS